MSSWIRSITTGSRTKKPRQRKVLVESYDSSEDGDDESSLASSSSGHLPVFRGKGDEDEDYNQASSSSSSSESEDKNPSKMNAEVQKAREAVERAVEKVKKGNEAPESSSSDDDFDSDGEKETTIQRKRPRSESSASSSSPNDHLSIIDVLNIEAIGFATPWPAISGADPCIGS